MSFIWKFDCFAYLEDITQKLRKNTLKNVIILFVLLKINISSSECKKKSCTSAEQKTPNIGTPNSVSNSVS